jgi:hypothetical protein
MIFGSHDYANLPRVTFAHSKVARVTIDWTWRDVWLVVTPVWAILIASRVLCYTLERLRFPDMVPPATPDAVQGMLLWPVCVLGVYCTLRTWLDRCALSAASCRGDPAYGRSTKAIRCHHRSTGCGGTSLATGS